jgi:hypothetical protein
MKKIQWFRFAERSRLGTRSGQPRIFGSEGGMVSTQEHLNIVPKAKAFEKKANSFNPMVYYLKKNINDLNLLTFIIGHIVKANQILL